MRSKIIEFCLVMSCFILFFTVNALQSLEEQNLSASYNAWTMKQKLALEDNQAAEIQKINLKFYKTISAMRTETYTDQHSYQQAITRIKHSYHDSILHTLTPQQQKQWKEALRENCENTLK